MATQPTVQISIHASAKEATLDEQKPFKVVLYISIHASAKEATPHICGHSKGDYFNPRLREGGDIVADNPLLSHFDFNPRLREGGDNKRG